MKRGKRWVVNILGICVALGIAFLAIVTANGLLEKGETDRIGRVEQVSWEEQTLVPLDAAKAESTDDYQILVDKLLCWAWESNDGFLQQTIREPRQGELDMESAYLRSLAELKKLQKAGMSLEILENEENLSLDSAELLSSYSERFGECARWILHIRFDSGGQEQAGMFIIQIDAATGCIYSIEIVDNQGFHAGNLRESTQAMARYLGLDPDTDFQVREDREDPKEAWVVLQTQDLSLEINGYERGDFSELKAIEGMEQAVAAGAGSGDMPLPTSLEQSHYFSLSLNIPPDSPILFS